ncbi:hypothetical protein OIU77_015806 [Salix suchowensis]|uniref:Yippee domain-containing protein n=1 Tax=Salix suchowensis TaxID=1278906 RepID=A0ABQ8ZIA6_9ROSI|nr:hypothetical protein OIU77_015806 [Salix suchowensis]KAJ6301571.1 hypothetical protein OIU77_015806 [Salix suchowensis]
MSYFLKDYYIKILKIQTYYYLSQLCNRYCTGGLKSTRGEEEDDMGRIFVVELEGRSYRCKFCGTHLALPDQLVSKVSRNPPFFLVFSTVHGIVDSVCSSLLFMYRLAF